MRFVLKKCDMWADYCFRIKGSELDYEDDVTNTFLVERVDNETDSYYQTVTIPQYAMIGKTIDEMDPFEICERDSAGNLIILGKEYLVMFERAANDPNRYAALIDNMIYNMNEEYFPPQEVFMKIKKYYEELKTQYNRIAELADENF